MILISLQSESPDALELAAEFESEGVPTRLPMIVLEELYAANSAVSGELHVVDVRSARLDVEVDDITIVGSVLETQ